MSDFGLNVTEITRIYCNNLCMKIPPVHGQTMKYLFKCNQNNEDLL
jgi:hypothetical protein